MRNTILPLTLLFLVLALVACSGAAPGYENANSSTNVDSLASDGNGDNVDPQFSMPAETTLMLGTVMLEETDFAVDSDQAAALLPLWKALRSFSESDTTAQVEVDALTSQIEESMTPEQVKAIKDMELTMQDMGKVAEILGIEMGGFGGGNFGEITPEMRETMQAMRESGEFQRPGGDFPGGGPGGGQGSGGGLGGGEMDPAARETAIAERGGTRGARSGLNLGFLDAIIEFLETKIQ